MRPARAAGSFDGVAVTMDHPRGGVNSTTWRQLAVGDVRGPVMAGNQVEATVTIRDQKAIDAVQKGKRHLSCGYDFELVAQPGRTDAGEAYEFSQQNVRGNHVALVDQARCGKSCQIGDSDDSDTVGADAARNNTSSINREERQVAQLIIDGAIFSVADEGLAAAIKVLQQRISAFEKQSRDFRTAVADRSRVTHQVANLIPGFQISDSMDANTVRRAALEKLLTANSGSAIARVIGSGLPHGHSVGDSSDEQLEVLFNAAVAAAEQEKKNSAERTRRIGADILSGASNRPQFIRNSKDAEQNLSGRDLWVWRLQNGEFGAANSEEL